MQIGEIARGRVITINATEPVARALYLMQEESVRHLPVMKGRSPVGIVTDHNVLHQIGWHRDQAKLASMLSTRVEKIMRSPIVTMSPSEAIKTIAEKMLSRGIGAVPLMEHERLVGIATKTDILKCFLTENPVVDTQVREQAVKNCMTRDVVHVGPDDATLEAVHLMQSKQIQHLPVLESEQLVGMLSDRDIMRGTPRESFPDTRLGAHASLAFALHVRGIMTPECVRIQPDTPLAQVAEILVEKKIGALPVVASDQLLGIVTETDLLKVLVGPLASSREFQF